MEVTSDMDTVIEAAVGTYGDILYRFCLVTLGNTGDAEDAVQETFIRYLRKRPVFRDEEHEKAWLLKVAQNKCRDILRWRARHRTVDIDEIAAAAGPAENTGILDALFSLPEKYRTVLLLCCVEGFTTAEAAKIIGRTPSAVKMRLQKGRSLLKQAYEEMEEI